MNISAILCVYNEIDNIDLIISNIINHSFDELIIIDGGSTDGTFEELATISEVQLRQLKNVGLLAQRLYGINISKSDHLFLFNADDNISSINFESLINEFYCLKADGLQIRTSSKCLNEYWSKAWSEYFHLIYPIHKKMNWLGRPCLALKRHFEGIVVNQNIFNEDTYLKYEQEKLFGKLCYYSSEQVVDREMPKGLRNNVHQFIRYGRSDASLTNGSISKFIKLIYHSLIRIAVLRSFGLIVNGKIKYSFFTLSMGIWRGLALLFYKIKS